MKVSSSFAGLRRGFLAAAPLFFLFVAVAAEAAELLMVRQPGCPYCRRWDAEIGPMFSQTPEAKRAPLRHVDKSEIGASGVALAQPVIYTPTFLLVVDHREIGRIEGYTGQDFFWPRLGRLLEKLPAP